MIPSARSFSMICFRLCKSAVSASTSSSIWACGMGRVGHGYSGYSGDSGYSGAGILEQHLTLSVDRLLLHLHLHVHLLTQLGKFEVFAFRTDSNYVNWINFSALCRLICRLHCASALKYAEISTERQRNHQNDAALLSFCHSKLQSSKRCNAWLKGGGEAWGALALSPSPSLSMHMST